MTRIDAETVRRVQLHRRRTHDGITDAARSLGLPPYVVAAVYRRDAVRFNEANAQKATAYQHHFPEGRPFGKNKTKAEKLAFMHERYAARKAAGLCVICEKPTDGIHVCCQKCRERRYKLEQVRRGLLKKP